MPKLFRPVVCALSAAVIGSIATLAITGINPWGYSLLREAQLRTVQWSAVKGDGDAVPFRVPADPATVKLEHRVDTPLERSLRRSVTAFGDVTFRVEEIERRAGFDVRAMSQLNDGLKQIAGQQLPGLSVPLSEFVSQYVLKPQLGSETLTDLQGREIQHHGHPGYEARAAANGKVILVRAFLGEDGIVVASVTLPKEKESSYNGVVSTFFEGVDAPLPKKG
jgi:hypothetical protein